MNVASDLHQRGLAAAGAGRFEEAVALLGQAVAAAPGERAPHTNLGLALVRLGRHDEAVAAYRAALTIDPGHAATLAKLGRVLTQAGRPAEAVESLRRAAALDPANPDTANALGAALAGQIECAAEARAAFRRAVELDPAFGEAWRNLGLLEAREERWDEAVKALGRAVQLEPAEAQLFYQYGVASGAAGRREESRNAYRRAVEMDPRLTAGWNNLGHQLAALGEPEAALEAVQRALRLEPHFVAARYNLGVTMQSLGRDDEARKAYQLVLAAAGPHADTLNNLGGLCLAEAEPALAAELYERALGADAAHPEARWNLGLSQLSLGRWRSGWKNYEERKPQRTASGREGIPRWRSGDDLSGRGIALLCEQGLGDGVQFLRYASEVRKLGAARVTVECPARLAPLFRLAEGIDEVAERSAASQTWTADYYVPLMSLPYELGTQEETIPAPGPNYRLPEERRSAWRARLDAEGPSLKVGIVWGGNPDNAKGLVRSMPLAEMVAPLASVCPNVKLISLQHGPQCEELSGAAVGYGSLVADWPQADLVDTAALVAELDLVITVDTLMAHLAGALCRRTWVALPFAADWRWMTAPRENSPWYPGRMRLFRQPKRADWAGAMKSVCEALAAIVVTGAEAARRG